MSLVAQRLPSCGVVVIGLNCEKTITDALQSVNVPFFESKWYIDSRSSDASVSIAQRWGFCTYVLSPEAPQSAAAGRKAGTLLCRTDWILFLDSDMVLQNGILEAFRSKFSACASNCCGFTGLVRNVYPTGPGEFIVCKAVGQNRRARWFGGMSVLRRDAVVKAGNWNPFVIANEELELYAKLKAQGYYVQLLELHVADHHTRCLEKLDKMRLLLDVGRLHGSRFGSIGMALHSAFDAGATLELFLLNPEPFLAFPVTLLCLGLATGGYSLQSILLISLLWIWIAYRRGPQYVPVSYLLFPQIFAGWCKYGETTRSAR